MGVEMKKREMQLDEAVKFFGYPHENQDFDLYLTSLDIKERPKWEDNPIAYVSKEDSGFIFIFGNKSSYEKYHGKAVVGGQMIFEGIQLYGDKYKSTMLPYQLPLPFGLEFNMSLGSIKKVLGEPDLDHPSGPINTVYIWRNFKRYSVGICCLPKDSGVVFFDIRPVKSRDL